MFSFASRESSSRQLLGKRPDWATARQAATASSYFWKRTDALARNCGFGRTRIQASVITPSVPSEPSISRSGLGPAPEPGSRREAQTSPSFTPAGVSARIAAVRSSMWV